MMARPHRDSAEATAPAPTYTGTAEDYLKAIYELARTTGTAATNEIARQLGLAPPSVSSMVRRLAEQGLLKYERYHGVRLTQVGQRAALRILRRHRIIETYLARQLGYPWDKVHAEAEHLEHAASDELVDRMAAVLDEPTVDPHGAPIPTRDGRVAHTTYGSISDLKVGDRADVVGVSDDDPARLRYVAELGLVPGASVVVLACAPFEGPITIRVVGGTGGERSIGPALARAILVAPSPVSARVRKGSRARAAVANTND
jgi:DtxR family transcriptional regulator, Mn-dependent transcriptional regulator